MKKCMSRRTRFSCPVALQMFGWFYYHAHFSAVIKPQTSLLRLSYDRYGCGTTPSCHWNDAGIQTQVPPLSLDNFPPPSALYVWAFLAPNFKSDYIVRPTLKSAKPLSVAHGSTHILNHTACLLMKLVWPEMFQTLSEQTIWLVPFHRLIWLVQIATHLDRFVK